MTKQTNLSHSPKHFVTSPLWNTPIIIVLFHSPYTDRAVTAAAATQEPSAGDMALAAVQSRVWQRENVPVGLILVVHSPTGQQ